MGQHKGSTYEDVSRKIECMTWAIAQPSPTAQTRDFLMLNRYIINQGSRETHASIGIPEGAYKPRPQAKGPKKIPPNPPIVRCTTCTGFK